MRFLFFLAALPLMASTVSAQLSGWHLDYFYALAQERLDPIVNVNAVASHMHRIFGGSAFGASYSFASLRNSTCSSAAVQSDKSNYWAPQLYLYYANASSPGGNSFVPIPASGRFYYFLGLGNKTNPFPEGLRMIAGDPNAKQPQIIYNWFCQQNSDFSNSLSDPGFNFNSTCPYGVKFDLSFPSCWDGVNLYLPGSAHMKYPSGGDLRSGTCPYTHPYRMPTIMLEFTFAVGQVNTQNLPMNGHLILSNGDTTGYGVHADFTNGWDTDVLRQAINSPSCVVGQAIPMEQCPILAARMNVYKAQTCKPDLGLMLESYGNDDGVPISALPGCNPIWSSGPKPGCSTPPSSPNVAKFTGSDGPYQVPAASQQNVKFNQNPGWSYVGCFAPAQVAPTFPNNSIQYADPALTPDRCLRSCSDNGYPFAGLQQIGTAWNCLCAPNLAPTAGMVDNSNCQRPCPGNANSTCGGPYFQQTWYQNTTYAKIKTDGVLVGCYAQPGNQNDPSNMLNQALSSFQSSSITVDYCAQTCDSIGAPFSGIRNNQCFCLSNLAAGSGVWVPSNFCTVACAGNKTQTCGDIYRASVYNTKNWLNPSLANPSINPLLAADPNLGGYGSSGSGGGSGNYGSVLCLNYTTKYITSIMTQVQCAVSTTLSPPTTTTSPVLPTGNGTLTNGTSPGSILFGSGGGNGTGNCTCPSILPGPTVTVTTTATATLYPY